MGDQIQLHHFLLPDRLCNRLCEFRRVDRQARREARLFDRRRDLDLRSHRLRHGDVAGRFFLHAVRVGSWPVGQLPRGAQGCRRMVPAARTCAGQWRLQCRVKYRRDLHPARGSHYHLVLRLAHGVRRHRQPERDLADFLGLALSPPEGSPEATARGAGLHRKRPAAEGKKAHMASGDVEKGNLGLFDRQISYRSNLVVLSVLAAGLPA